MAKTLYGSVTKIDKCVGYCYHHRKWLTLRQLRLKKCLSKGGHEYCHALRIREEHPWWEIRKKRKAERREDD